ncbi:HDL182Cp [Eremothecium sinecaudum]|uniref:HDL182Cp n=1 Tax=Eremothecium sinecaudum TaxID=45286 RepID=A0A0X8HSB5_9SACH|nr:HDL182Cp [Eremothecium sinecaudum]AMD20562.1 HDL182Cp [Eremothecium sinecaudum]
MRTIKTTGKAVLKRKLSYVCTVCKKCKSKCDKLKPSCSRCLSLGLECSYDIEKQLADDPNSKDEILRDLEEELAYWKKKSKDIEEARCQGVGNVSELGKSSILGILPEFSSILSNTNIDELKFNCYIQSAFHRNAKSFMFKDYKLNYLIGNSVIDRFLSPLLDRIIENNLEHAKDLHGDQDETISHVIMFKVLEKQVIHEYEPSENLNKIMKDIEDIRDQRYTGDSTKAGFFFAIAVNSMEFVRIEDINLRGYYSANLQYILDNSEKNLPSYEVIEYHKRNFYKHVYPIVPVIEISIFEECLADIIKRDPEDSGKVKIDFGKYNLRHKLINLSILMVVLAISSYHEDSCSVHESPNMHQPGSGIYGELLFLSKMCIAHLDVIHQPDEQHLTCLILLWYSCTIHPEFRSTVTKLEAADILMGLIVNIGGELGLCNDPLEYYQFKEGLVDRRLINYRRKLGISVMPIVMYHIDLTSMYPNKVSHFSIFKHVQDMSDDLIPNYLWRVAKDMVQYSHFELEVHKITLVRHILCKWMDDLNMLKKSKSYCMNLTEIKRLSSTIFDVLTANFPLQNASAPPQPKAILDLGYDTVEIDLSSHMANMTIIYHLSYYLLNLQLERSLVYCIERSTKILPGNVPAFYHQRFLNITKYIMCIFQVSNNYHHRKYSLLPTSTHSTMVHHLVHVTLTISAYAAFSLYLKFAHAEYVIITNPSYKQQLYKNLPASSCVRIKQLYSNIVDQIIAFIENNREMGFESLFQSWLVLKQLQNFKDSGLALNILLSKTDSVPQDQNYNASNNWFAYLLQHLAKMLIDHLEQNDQLLQLLQNCQYTHFSTNISSPLIPLLKHFARDEIQPISSNYHPVSSGYERDLPREFFSPDTLF